jgi:hypothetical protein
MSRNCWKESNKRVIIIAMTSTEASRLVSEFLITLLSPLELSDCFSSQLNTSTKIEGQLQTSLEHFKESENGDTDLNADSIENPKRLE